MHSWDNGRRAAQHARMMGSAMIDVEGRVRRKHVYERTTDFYIVFAYSRHDEVVPPTVAFSRFCADGMGSSSMFRRSTVVTANQ